MAVDTRSFVISLGINAGICLACFIVLSWLRNNSFTKRYYAPKRYAQDIVVKPKRLSGYVAWIWQIWSMPEHEIANVAGVDSAVFLRILSFGNTIFFWLSLWCLVVILPVNVTDTYVQQLLNKNPGLPADQQYHFSDLDKLYITNIKPGSQRLWVHVISVYVVTLIVLKFLWDFNKETTVLRLTYLAKSPKGGPSHTVLLTDVPGLYRDVDKQIAAEKNKEAQEKSGKDSRVQLLQSDEETFAIDQVAYAKQQLLACGSAEAFVDKELRDAYGDYNVDCIHLVYDESALAPLVAKFYQVKQQLQDLLDNYQSMMRRHKPIKRRQVRVISAIHGAWAAEKYGTKPVKVDAAEFYVEQLRHLMQQIKEEQVKAKQRKTSSTFATFNNRYTQVVAATSMLTSDERTWKPQDAPGPEEVVWENVPLRASERAVRNMINWGLFVLIIIFYIPVTAALQAFLNIDQLENTPGIKVLVGLPFIRDIIIGVLPGIVLTIFLAILPNILALMNRKAGMISLSQIDFGVVKQYFIFQVLTVFIASAMSGTFLANARVIIANPSDVMGIFKLIATGLPQQASFFMTWLAVNGLLNKPIAFLRVVGLVIFYVFFAIAGTERARTRLWANQSTLFGAQVADHTMAIVFGLVFCVQAPIICPVALVYFIIQTIINRYQLVYVFRLPYQSGGKMWREVFSQIMFALYCFQVVIVFLLAVKGFPYTVLIIPVLPITMAFHVTSNALFDRPWRIMSLQAAARLDRVDLKKTAEAEARAQQLDAAAAKPGLEEGPHTLPPGKAAGAELPSQQDAGAAGISALLEKNPFSLPAPTQGAPQVPAGEELGKGGVKPASSAAAAHNEDEEDLYLAPVFKVGQDDLEELVQEAQEVMGKVEAYEARGIPDKAGDKAEKAAERDVEEAVSEDDAPAAPVPVKME